MANLSLTACSFILKKRHSRGNYLYLNDAILKEDDDGDVGYSLDRIFESFFNNHSQAIDDEISKRTFHCQFDSSFCGETTDYKYLYCIVKSGIYGSSSEILDKESRVVLHRKTAIQTEEKPFYLYIVIPKDSIDGSVKVQKGMLFFQNIGQFGVKTTTSNYIKEYFRLNYNITFECKTIATKLFVERMIKQENIKQIIMTKNNKSNDGSDNISKGYGAETKIIGKLIFKEEIWSTIMSRIHHFSQAKFNLFELESEFYDQLKLKVTINDRDRIINMGYLENLSIIEAIPDEIQASDGHPKKQLLLEHFERVANDYLSEMVLQIEKW